MKARLAVLGLLLTTVGATVFAAARPQEPDRAQGPKPPDAAAMKRYMEFCTPDQHQKDLAQFLGKWNVTSSMAKCTAEYRWLVEGRWLLCEMKGTMMGMPLQAFTITGYDNYKKKWVSAHVDSLTTTLLTSTGTVGQKGSKELILYGEMDEPLTDEHDKMVKYVTRVLGEDKHVIEVHDMAIGEENTKVVELVFTRAK